MAGLLLLKTTESNGNKYNNQVRIKQPHFVVDDSLG
jgi:hypothetical protein